MARAKRHYLPGHIWHIIPLRRRWKMEATALNPVGKKREDSRQKREKNNLAGIL